MIRLVLASSFALLAALPASAEEPQPRFRDTPSIRVSGSAVEMVPYDRAKVTATLVLRGKAIEEVAPDLARRAADLVAALRGLGLADADLRTSGPALSDVWQTTSTYDPKGNRSETRRKSGTEGRFSVVVSLDRIDRVAAVVKTVTGAGAELGGVAFEVSDQRNIERRLQEAAVRDAGERARLLILAAGHKPGRLLELTDPSLTPPDGQADLPLRPPGSFELPIPILPGKAEIKVTMEATYEILPP